MYWRIFNKMYEIDDEGCIGPERNEIYSSDRIDEFGSAFGHFVLACGRDDISKVWIKVYRGDFDTNGDIVCAYSNEWDTIQIKED